MSTTQILNGVTFDVAPISSGLQITTGAGVGKVLVSDSSGNAAWTTFTSASLGGTQTWTGVNSYSNTTNFAVAIFNNTATTSATLSGGSSGTCVFVQPEQGSGYKKVIIYCNNLANATAGTATITYPTVFLHQPVLVTTASVGGVTPGLISSRTTTALVITTSITPITGFIILEGF